MRYFLRLAYDGTDYHGWQRQPNGTSVQQTLEDALSVILQERTDITGAGRTDAGVHASEMYAHFDTRGVTEPSRLLTSLNRMVGNAISVTELIPVKDDAHARFDAISRSYRYYISLKKNPFKFRFSHFMNQKPDIETMNEAARLLLETKDFTSFAKLHSDAKTNICKVTEAYWEYDSGEEVIKFNITADRFLRNMVRAVVGTLIEVGRGKLTLSGFKDVITKRDRCEAGVSMPAKGLFLTEIKYPDNIWLA